MVRLGILILNYNNGDLTNDLCKTLPEAIVIDNGSQKGKEYKGKNRCIRFTENKHFTAGWNAGVKEVWNEFDAFWLCNNDIKLTRKDVERVQWVLDNHKDVGLFTPTYNCWLQWARNQKTGGLRDVGMIEFTAPVVRKELYKEYGMWDERFKRGYGVEFDWCLRIREDKKWRICVDDGCSFHHMGQQTTDHMPGYYTDAIKELKDGINALYGFDWKSTIFKDIAIDFNYNFLHGTGGNRFVVFTTIFGDYDKLKTIPKQSLHRVTDYICITDNPNLACPSPWKLRVVNNPTASMHPRLRAKYYKLLWFEDEVLKQYYKSVYIDASIEVKSAAFVQAALDDLHDMKLFRHPARTKIKDEVVISRKLNKYTEEKMEEQVQHYIDEGYPDERLYACGVLSRINNEKVRNLMKRWWEENLYWTIQDQLSFPYVCWLYEFTPDVWNADQENNPYFNIRWHDDKAVAAPVNTSDHKPHSQFAKTAVRSVRPVSHAVPKAPAVNLTFSMLMPVYNTPIAWLKESMESIFNQTDLNFELVIVDDGSTDPEVVSYLEGISRTSVVKVVYHRFEENQKIAKALNKGLELASGDVVIRMDADDKAYRRMVETIKGYWARNPETVCVGIQIRGFFKRNYVTKHAETITRNMAFRRGNFWFVNHPGVSYKRNIVLERGGYGESLIPAEDYWLWTELLKRNYVIKNMMKVLLDHRVTHPSPRDDEYMKFLQSCKDKLKP